MASVANAEINLVPYTCTDNVSFVFMGTKSDLVEIAALKKFHEENKPKNDYSAWIFVGGFVLGVWI